MRSSSSQDRWVYFKIKTQLPVPTEAGGRFSTLNPSAYAFWIKKEYSKGVITMSKTRNDALDINNARYFLSIFALPRKG